ncbi:MAG: prolipoprotein diacylglyceryl transferase [Oscillospiraceae bacterium]|nr:prolipoprotein diacylglyceryl transferase [Oscillospiraceae bacterium]
MNTIEFPGFGLGPFEINSVAIKNFFWSGRDIAWYGIFVTFGILCGIFYAFWRGQKNNGIKVDDMIDVAIFSIPAAIIGARLYYVLFNLKAFPTLFSVFEIWNGGLAVYGGIIAGLFTALLVCRFKKISVFKVFDSAAPAIMLGQIIGRWGNFTNAEVLGIKTELPWGMSINGASAVHPIFLYESLWNLLGFAIINLIYKKKKFDGQIFLMYMIWYGFGRMLLESIREEKDTLFFGVFRISQVVGFLCFVLGAAAVVVMAARYKNQKLEKAEYEGVYSELKAKIADDETDETDEKNEKNENEDAKS